MSVDCRPLHPKPLLTVVIDKPALLNRPHTRLEALVQGGTVDILHLWRVEGEGGEGGAAQWANSCRWLLINSWVHEVERLAVCVALTAQLTLAPCTRTENWLPQRSPKRRGPST